MSVSLPDPGGPPASPPTPSSAGALTEALIEEMTRAWQRGERPLAETYLTRHPELAREPGPAVELIYEEICLRREHGEEADPEQVVQRFPQWEQQLRILLDCHLLLEGGGPAPSFPEVGEVLGEFRLVGELGRGAQGRVFLATQPTLADRAVVLKLVPRVGQEHLSLARLQHTHIVPLYSVQDEPARNLRALCMPYFGGATLAKLLRALAGVPAGERRGEQLLGALRQAQLAQPVAVPVAGQACEFLDRASYTQALCWVGACVADALHYAHERGLVHLDLKPSNLLLAADGQPMLLDFHLARSPIEGGAAAPDWMGGTPGYMPPEQQLAVAAVREGRELPETVDVRADVYGLGVLLYESLAGKLPPPGEAPGQALRRHNPQVSPALAALLDRCLARTPAERYPDAASLAVDLRRHLADLPLRGVAEGPAERWRKWRRRRPLALPLYALLLTVVAGAALGLGHVVRQAGKARVALEEGQKHSGQKQYALAISDLERGRALIEYLPFQGGLARELQGELFQARRAVAARELHQVVERVRELYGADLIGAADARALEAHCRPFWEKRGLILERLEPSAEPDPQVQADMLDLAILWTDLRVRLAGAAGAAAPHREALQVLTQAEALFGPSCVLYRARRSHAAALGLADLAQSAERTAAGLPARTAWEHHALGLALLHDGAVADAAAEFDLALDLQPQALWPNFYRGKCAYQLGHFEDAVVAFTACVTLAPDRAVFAYNRGLAYAGLGRPDRALRDYDRALRLDPSLAAAALSRGTLNYQQKRYPEALADLLRAREKGANPAVVHYDLALVRLARGEHAAALADLQEALRHDPTHRDARLLLDKLRAGD